MKKALIENGIVVGVVDGDIVGVEIPDGMPVTLNWRFEQSEFLPPLPVDPVLLVPQQVTRYQARAALYKAGLLDDVEGFMALPDTDRLLVLAWQDAQTFKRHSPMVVDLGKVLGLTAAQIDELFIAAAAIE